MIYQTSPSPSWKHNSSFCPPQPPPQPRALEAEAQAQACVFGMWAFFGTITLLGTAIPSALQWSLPAFLWLGRRPLANCPGFPAVSLCSAPEKGFWPARPNALGAAGLLWPQGSRQAPLLVKPTGKSEVHLGGKCWRKEIVMKKQLVFFKENGPAGSSLYPHPSPPLPPKSWI